MWRCFRTFNVVDDFNREALAIEINLNIPAQRAEKHGVLLEFIMRGKPTDNITVESFNDRLRQEYLNKNWFMSLKDARCKIEAWRIHYNQSRSHSALG